jgi:putative ABC transport system substrate-binding protein
MMRICLQRREFIAFLGGAAAAWPLDASAEKAAVPVIGFLNNGSPGSFRALLDQFRKGLSEGGFVEGSNLAIEYRWADGQQARLPQLAADLVRLRVSLIAATGGSIAAQAAQAATTTIPILFIGGPDPVAGGLATSLNRPGGNATGVAMETSELMPKRVQLLLELLPGAAKIALLLNPAAVGADALKDEVEKTIRALGRQMLLLSARAETDLEPAFMSAVQQRADALLVTSNSFFTDRRSQIVALAARYRLPAAYAWREFVEAGGLVSYGPSIAWAYHQVGQYAGRILKGETPRDLPVQRPAKFELVINLKVAKSLGLTVPRITLLRADEVIE